MPIQPEFLADALGLVFAALCLAGVCIWHWRLFAPISGDQFRRVLFWSHCFGFFLSGYVYFLFLAIVAFEYSFDIDWDVLAVAALRTGIACVAFAFVISLMIRSLMIPRLKNGQEQVKG